MFRLIFKERPTIAKLYHGKKENGKVPFSVLPVDSVFDYYVNNIQKCAHVTKEFMPGGCNGQCQWAWLVHHISRTAAPMDIERYLRAANHPGVLLEDFTEFGIKRNYFALIINKLLEDTDDDIEESKKRIDFLSDCLPIVSSVKE